LFDLIIPTNSFFNNHKIKKILPMKLQVYTIKGPQFLLEDNGIIFFVFQGSWNLTYNSEGHVVVGSDPAADITMVI
jgi:hypothetical protein